MLDSIEIIVNYNEQGIPRGNLECMLQRPEIVTDRETGRWKRTQGEYGRQWYCTITDKHIKIFGSVPKEIHGTNMYNADKQTICNHFDYMSNTLGIDLLDGYVNKIDVAHNLQMDEPPVRYYPYLGTVKGFKQMKKDTTLDYVGRRGNKVRNVFYDKIVEQDDKRRNNVPLDMQGLQWLRFETRITSGSQVAKVLGVVKPTLTDCLMYTGYEKLFEHWLYQYNNIPKVNNIDYMIKDVERITPRVAKDGLLISLIAHLGEHHIEQFAELVKAKGLWGKDMVGYNNKAVFLKDMKRLVQQHRTDQDYITELNEAVKKIECR